MNLDALREALEQQRKYERENWPFVGDNDEPLSSGENISYHLASLYCWPPEYVLSLPEQERDERLKEIWKSFALAGDIIKRYEEAATALLRGAIGMEIGASCILWGTSTQMPNTESERKTYLMTLQDGKKSIPFNLQVHADGLIVAEPRPIHEYDYDDLDDGQDDYDEDEDNDALIYEYIAEEEDEEGNN